MRYASNSVITHIDPSGGFWNIIIGAGIGAAIGAVSGWLNDEDGGVDGLLIGAGSGLVGGAVGGATFSPSLGGGIASGVAAGLSGGITEEFLELPTDDKDDNGSWSWQDIGVRTVCSAIGGSIVGGNGGVVIPGVADDVAEGIAAGSVETITTEVYLLGEAIVKTAEDAIH